MTAPANRVEIEELPIPATLDGSAEARDFEQSVEARNASEFESYGLPEMEFTAAELLPGWQPSAHAPRRLLGARVDGRIVARGTYETRVEGDAAGTAVISVQVHPKFTRRGIGRALADRAESFATEEGRTHLRAFATSAPAEGPRITPPTGAGSLPANGREVRFLLARGYTLEQVERGSRLELPVDPEALAERRAVAEERASGYRVHLWEGRAPAERLDDLAVLATRMSTDAPSGGLDAEEDLWTVDRWLEKEGREAESPRTSLSAAVEHVASGRLVGYTQLNVPAEAGRGVEQNDTIVMREHRGHRLGMLLKVVNIQQLQDRYPRQRSIITFNAEENRHMLDVNEAVGFVPFTYEGAWQKRL